MDTEYKSAPFELTDLKASDTGWTFTGYVSTYGNLDHVGDVVVSGAFDRTLRERKSRPLLWAHDTHEPIGVEKSLVSDERGLLGTWELAKTTRGTDAHALLKLGAVNRMSMGFIPLDVEYDDMGIRKLLAIDLLESSLVSIPANEQAVVVRVKADLPFDQLLQRAVEHLKLGVAEAEALHARRVSDKRELTERHLAAIKALDDAVKAAGSSLEALLTAPTDEVSGDWKLRLELARRRLTRLGIDVEAA